MTARGHVLDELQRRHPAAFAAWHRAPDVHDLGRLLGPAVPGHDGR